MHDCLLDKGQNKSFAKQKSIKNDLNIRNDGLTNTPESPSFSI